MDTYSYPAIAVKFATDPLDCDTERALTPGMRTERAIVADLLHHLLQFGIVACGIPGPEVADPAYREDRLVMEWVFQRGAGEVELEVSAGGQPVGKILLRVGGGGSIVKSWEPANGDAALFNKAMSEFCPNERPDLIELIRAVDESSFDEDCPKGLSFVDTAALTALVRAARRSYGGDTID